MALRRLKDRKFDVVAKLDEELKVELKEEQQKQQSTRRPPQGKQESKHKDIDQLGQIMSTMSEQIQKRDDRIRELEDLLKKTCIE